MDEEERTRKREQERKETSANKIKKTKKENLDQTKKKKRKKKEAKPTFISFSNALLSPTSLHFSPLGNLPNLVTPIPKSLKQLKILSNLSPTVRVLSAPVVGLKGRSVPAIANNVY